MDISLKVWNTQDSIHRSYEAQVDSSDQTPVFYFNTNLNFTPVYLLIFPANQHFMTLVLDTWRQEALFVFLFFVFLTYQMNSRDLPLFISTNDNFTWVGSSPEITILYPWT